MVIADSLGIVLEKLQISKVVTIITHSLSVVSQKVLVG